MMKTEETLTDLLGQQAARMNVNASWSLIDLKTEHRISTLGDEPTPTSTFDTLFWYVALVYAGYQGEVDLRQNCTLESRHRQDGHRGVIGCMSEGLRLQLGDFLAQTVITGDPVAFAVAKEAIELQGVSATQLVNHLLQQFGAGPVEGRATLSHDGLTGVSIGSTSTDEVVNLLKCLVESPSSSSSRSIPREVVERCLQVFGSVHKGGGLGRGLPGYGPFSTKVAHVARGGSGNNTRVRNDGAIFYDGGSPRIILGVSITGIPEWQGNLPGLAVAEDFMMRASQLAWRYFTGAQLQT